MLRLLGILGMGNLIFGGRRRHCRRHRRGFPGGGLLIGTLLGLFISRANRNRTGEGA